MDTRDAAARIARPDRFQFFSDLPRDELMRASTTSTLPPWTGPSPLSWRATQHADLAGSPTSVLTPVELANVIATTADLEDKTKKGGKKRAR